jgi:hypothetical protein
MWITRLTALNVEKGWDLGVGTSRLFPLQQNYINVHWGFRKSQFENKYLSATLCDINSGFFNAV